MDRKEKKFYELTNTMKILRGENGCEWDKEQTHKSLKPYLIEEAYEVLKAIDEEDSEELKNELGDVLLQVIFHAQIAEDQNEFDIEDVIDNLNQKLIRRHPHVFANEKGYSYKRWEEIKAREKGKENDYSVLGDLNNSLPALSLARRVQENAATVGFDWENKEDVFKKIVEETKELKRELIQKNRTGTEEEFGDLLFSLVNFSRFIEVDPETSLKRATIKFMNRFKKMEGLISEDKKNIENLDINELDNYWKRVKEVSK